MAGVLLDLDLATVALRAMRAGRTLVSFGVACSMAVLVSLILVPMDVQDAPWNEPVVRLEPLSSSVGFVAEGVFVLTWITAILWLVTRRANIGRTLCTAIDVGLVLAFLYAILWNVLATQLLWLSWPRIPDDTRLDSEVYTLLTVVLTFTAGLRRLAPRPYQQAVLAAVGGLLVLPIDLLAKWMTRAARSGACMPVTAPVNPHEHAELQTALLTVSLTCLVLGMLVHAVTRRAASRSDPTTSADTP